MPHLILIVIVLVALVMLVRWLFRSPEATLGALPVSSIAEVKDGETCKLIGTVSAAPECEEAVRAPFSRREALICFTRLFRDGGNDEAVRQVLAVPRLRVEDATGSLLVQPLPPEGADLQPSLTLAADGEKVLRLLPMEPVDALLEATGHSRQSLGIASDASELPDGLTLAENVLSAGDRVVIVGWCSGEGEVPTIIPKKGKLLFISNDPDVIKEMVRGAMSAAERNGQEPADPPKNSES